MKHLIYCFLYSNTRYYIFGHEAFSKTGIHVQIELKGLMHCFVEMILRNTKTQHIGINCSLICVASHTYLPMSQMVNYYLLFGQNPLNIVESKIK